MNITKIGKRVDGTLVGEDEDGKLYNGVQKLVGFDALTRTVAGGKVEFRYGDQLQGKGNSTEEADGTYPCEKILEQVTVIEDGVRSMQTQERLLEVVDWSAV